MQTALGILLALLTVEALALIVRPARCRAIISETSDRTLRVIGIIEIILVVVLLAFAYGFSV